MTSQECSCMAKVRNMIVQGEGTSPDGIAVSALNLRNLFLKTKPKAYNFIIKKKERKKETVIPSQVFNPEFMWLRNKVLKTKPNLTSESLLFLA